MYVAIRYVTFVTEKIFDIGCNKALNPMTYRFRDVRLYVMKNIHHTAAAFSINFSTYAGILVSQRRYISRRAVEQ